MAIKKTPFNIPAINNHFEALAKSLGISDDNDQERSKIEALGEQAGSFTLLASDVDGDPLSFSLGSLPSSEHGTVTLSGNTATFTPKPNWNGTTSFTFIAHDGRANSNTATVTLTVNPVNDSPVAQPESIAAAEDNSGSVTLTVTDPDIPYGDNHTFEIVSAPNAAHGSASITGSTLTFTPVANWNGSTSLTYRAKDEQGAYSAPATVSITITAVNDVPVAAPRSATTNEDTPASITLSATDIDSPVPTVFEVVAGPNAASGSVTITGGVATFNPAANWHGAASFTYRARDAQGGWSAPASVTVTVVPVNDAPSSSGTGLNFKTIESKSATQKYLIGQ